MLEHLVKLLVGNYKSDFVTTTENQEGRDNQQERLLHEKNPQRLHARATKLQDKVRTVRRLTEIQNVSVIS